MLARAMACVFLSAIGCSRETVPAPPPGPPGPPPPLALQDAFAGLRFRAPLQVLQAPGEARFFVVEKAGTVQAVSGTTASTFLDIRARVNSAPAEAGLLGLAVHPRRRQIRQGFLH